MATLKKINKKSKKGTKREYIKSAVEKKFLKKIGLQISYDLENKFDEPRPVEWLSWETEIARSALREIIAGRSNPKALTLLAISNAFDYKSPAEFLKVALK